ncbi:Acetyl xylan esterase [Pseudopedobacter saltans DSM 12145]|uniref:Acetyl xylan esterase n=1 Tax=Pseudopedobacter saltans (strain ATCC 51119 / DSM 12145 / JCM 21818 / CCUG 39354 / LMG 10337 / NBRC 100064 / NCIMB 13643) TaxID=762903 RepID=F0SCJ4_PSESL|nr:acetylxylan esterase [Pseudopedobacter saltans]ADY52828.1 Acetyl xylan esterase [Pseudopedobacter saltans DSM 12145]
MSPFKLIFLFLFISFGITNAQIKRSLWDVSEVYQTPAFTEISRDTVVSLQYEGTMYKGNRKQTFAYYCTPGILLKDKTKDRNLPAVVLVHGGGGTAFRNWVVMWAKRGYAAIAMDLRGNNGDKKHIMNGFQEPEGKTPYFAINNNIEEEWMYQAVTDVLLAHNLILSFPEIDKTKTALTGISWGGVISEVVAGLDFRFKAIVPVYGSGYLHYNTAMTKDLDALSPENRKLWIKRYDPSNYLIRSKAPILFINGTNDGSFYLDSYRKTYSLVKKKALSIKIGLRHNHTYGWSNPEIEAFIDSKLFKQQTLPEFRIVNDGANKAIKIKKGIGVSRSFLNYTDASDLKNAVWRQINIPVTYRKIGLDSLPKACRYYFYSIEGMDNLIVTSPVFSVH